VFFADLLQLPPVKGNQPFIPVTFLEAKQRLGAIASVDLWQTFSYDELTINMRQSGDKEYSDLLSNVRVGQITDDHFLLLAQRLITPGRRATVAEVCETFKALSEAGKSPLILMPTTALCREVNRAMLQQTGNVLINLTAEDTLDTIVLKPMRAKVEAAYSKISEDASITAGLDKHLELCVGARVMLKRNRDVEAGLVNGSVGTVVGFSSTSPVNIVKVKFDKVDCEINIERLTYSFEVLKGIYYTRKQFPLMPAFAITIHKSQGLSLQSAIVDAGPSSFGSGMVYVALSRVTALSGLHLIALDRSRIKCDRKAIDEYNRLRRLYTQLGDLPGGQLRADDEQDRQQQQNIAVNSKWRGRKRMREVNKMASADTSPVEVQPTKRQHTDNDMEDGHDAVIVAVTHHSIFQFCDIQSLLSDIQLEMCNSLNLAYVADELSVTAIVERAVSHRMQSAIYTQTQQTTDVTIYQAMGDGNCLFKSLSLGITGTQRQHNLMRSYIINNMLHSDVQQQLEQSFQTRSGGRLQQSHNNNQTYSEHLAAMQQNGEWGTEHEIIAAAHLFNCSIVCYSRYNSRDFCLQHFPPHYVTTPTCTSGCKHHTVYIVNSSGNHYNMATVTLINDTEE